MQRAWVMLAIFASGLGAQRPKVLIETALIGSDQRVHLRWTGRGETAEPPGEEQVGVSGLQVAPNRKAVGWAVERDGEAFGTSYPMSLELIVVWQDGRRHSIFPGETLGPWHFEDGGRRVFVFSDSPHANGTPTCQLYDTGTGKLVATWVPGGQKRPPAWALPFRADWP